MFTVIMSLVGVVVFMISLLTTKSFKTSFKRLFMCTFAGLLIDLSLFALVTGMTYPLL